MALAPTIMRAFSMCGRAVAEGDLAGRGDLDAHLLLDVGDVGAVALARQLTGLVVEVDLGHQEQAEALGAGSADALDTYGAGEDEVHDVLGHVVLGRGDEALDALDVPRAVLVGEGLGAAGADVGAGIGLGEHHRGAPLAVDHVLGDLLVAVGAVLEHDAGEAGAGGVHPHRCVGAQDELGARPDERGGAALAAHLLGDLDAPPLGVHPGLVRLGERGVHGDGLGVGVVHRRVAVGVVERRGERAGGQALDLGEDVARGVGVDLLEDPGAVDAAAVEQLEEIELDVAQVALVMAHASIPSGVCAAGSSLLLGSNLSIRLRRREDKSEPCITLSGWSHAGEPPRKVL
jgi:hypothetical protein